MKTIKEIEDYIAERFRELEEHTKEGDYLLKAIAKVREEEA